MIYDRLLVRQHAEKNLLSKRDGFHYPIENSNG